MLSIVLCGPQVTILSRDLQPASPAGQAAAGVVGDAVLAVAVDAAVGHALVDVGRADVVLESVRTLALEHLAGVLANAAVLAFVVVAQDAAVEGHVLTALHDEAVGRGGVHLRKKEQSNSIKIQPF